MGRDSKNLPHIDILLATYNGQEFLPDQLGSILSQDGLGRDFSMRIFVRDDGSTDRTMPILRERADIHVGVDWIIQYRHRRDPEKGPTSNFSMLMEEARRRPAPEGRRRYFLFSDQDDLWIPAKIKTLLDHMTSLEEKMGPQTPLLLHSDLHVVDSDQNTISPSFWQYKRLHPSRHHDLNHLLVQNVVTGCACMFNEALLKIHRKPDNRAIVHDWWLALEAAAFGRVECIPAPLVYYRQHDQNSIGARSMKLKDIILGAFNLNEYRRFKKLHLRTIQQATLFFDIFNTRLPSHLITPLNHYRQLADTHFIKRKWFQFRYHFWATDLFRSIRLFFYT